MIGCTLWELNPRGKFYRLNALLPADDPPHELGVPEYHEPLVSSLLDDIDKGSLSSNNYCSPGSAWKLDVLRNPYVLTFDDLIAVRAAHCESLRRSTHCFRSRNSFIDHTITGR